MIRDTTDVRRRLMAQSLAASKPLARRLLSRAARSQASSRRLHREGDVRNWQDSSTAGVVGCFFVFLGLLLLAGWIAWQIMESAIPG
jgi:hypothetical protein